MTYVLTNDLCHAERATFAAGLVVHEPGRMQEPMRSWVADGNAQVLRRPSDEQKRTALRLDGHRAHREADDG
ncbi:MAG: hypothetical protein F4Z28_05080 [Gammaproteobacteria bacterium]|nr:hypothetical protein [Gammaproteobacteria bacterium]